MKKGIKNPGWSNWPDQKNKRDPDELFKTGARCDAWRSFFKSETVKKLREIEGRIIWFSRYEYFDKLICEFGCSEKELRSVIESLMRPECKTPVKFIRADIYDARAWASIPLNNFAKIEGCHERNNQNHWQWEILKLNEMPVIQFGIKLPWTVTRDCFKLTHRLKDDGRFAQMTFNHPQLDSRFENHRWVADKMFPRETSRDEMADDLFVRVESECAKHLVTIVD